MGGSCALPRLVRLHSSASRSSSFLRSNASGASGSTLARSVASCAAISRAPTVRSRRSGFGAVLAFGLDGVARGPPRARNASFRMASSLSSSSILTMASSSPSITRGSAAVGASSADSAPCAALVLGLPTGFKASRPLFALATCCLDWPMASASFGLSLARSSIGTANGARIGWRRPRSRPGRCSRPSSLPGGRRRPHPA